MLLDLLQAWLAQYQDGSSCAARGTGSGGSGGSGGSSGHAFGRAGQLQQALVLLGGDTGSAASKPAPAPGSICFPCAAVMKTPRMASERRQNSGNMLSGSHQSLRRTSRDSGGDMAAARRKQEAAAQTLTAPLVGAAGQLPKLDLYYLFRRYLHTHGGGLQIDTKVLLCYSIQCRSVISCPRRLCCTCSDGTCRHMAAACSSTPRCSVSDLFEN